jgi:ubiquinone/menaquinone biosynthesis C-methylase UbiE
MMAALHMVNGDGRDGLMTLDGKRIVREGYDAAAHAYLAARAIGIDEAELLADFARHLPPGARVLDAGCGAGVPTATLLAAGCQVIGVDVSAAQLALARERAPASRFIEADLTTLALPDAVFDGICCLYALIHVPRAEHAATLANFWRMLTPGGYLLLSIGSSDLDDDLEEDWLASGATMYWSHYPREQSLAMLSDAGFEIVQEHAIVESAEYGGGTHPFVLARRAACT